MKRVFAAAALAVSVLLAACTTTSTQLAFKDAPKPPAGARIVLLQPDVHRALLTAGGVQEPRADWSRQGKDNLAAEMQASLEARRHAFQMVDPETAMEGRTGQLLRLNEAVTQSIPVFGHIPTKKGEFVWTLGDGAQALGSAYQADYALFVTARGSYASSGRVVAMIGMAALGVGIPLGSQSAMASLVDLKTGRIVWYNTALAGPNADMREPEGAKALVTAMLKDAPL
jgi:hypothetical protein